MSEKDIVGKFSEPMGMDTSKGRRKRPTVIPLRPEGSGSPDRDYI